MKLSLKKIITTSVFTASILGSAYAQAELSANIGATSNYIWRGVTQTNYQAAVSGGVDYAHSSGLYAGTWVSNVSGGTESDYYGGFSGEAGALGYDIGYIAYSYPQDITLNFNEAYLGLSAAGFGLTYSMDSENKTGYVDLSYEFALSETSAIAIHYGAYSTDTKDDPTTVGTDEAKEANYSDYSVTLSNGDFAFGVSNTSKTADSHQAFVSWGQSFDF